MLKIVVEEYYRGNVKTKKILECPFCKERIIFYISSPIRCNNAQGCHRVIPDVAEIMQMKEARLAYHFQRDLLMHHPPLKVGTTP